MTGIIKKENSHKRFYVLLACLLLLVGVRYSLQIDIPRVIFVAIIGVASLLGDKDEILTLCMCCIPLHESIDLFFSLAIIMAVFVFKYFDTFRLHTDVFVVLAMIFWELVHCLWQEFNLINVLAIIAPLIVLAIVMSSDLSDFDYRFMTRVFAVVTLCCFWIFLIRVFYFYDFNMAKSLSGIYRLGLDRTTSGVESQLVGGQMNPNTLGIIAVLAITGLMQFTIKKQSTKWDVFISLSLVILGALTASRTYLACLVFMAMLLIFCQKGVITKKIRFIIGLAVVTVTALGILYAIFPDLLRYYISRFFVSDITTGRDGLFGAYNEFISSNLSVLLFGMGFVNYGARLTNEYRIGIVVPHNSVQEIIIAWGIPGVILLLMLLWCIHSSSRRYSKEDRLLKYIPLLILLFKSMAGQLMYSSYTMIAFSLAYISLCHDFNKADKEEKAN